MGLRSLEIFKLLRCGDRLYTSETDVYRRQNLTYKDGPLAERVSQVVPGMTTSPSKHCYITTQIVYHITISIAICQQILERKLLTCKINHCREGKLPMKHWQI